MLYFIDCLVDAGSSKRVETLLTEEEVAKVSNYISIAFHLPICQNRAVRGQANNELDDVHIFKREKNLAEGDILNSVDILVLNSDVNISGSINFMAFF